MNIVADSLSMMMEVDTAPQLPDGYEQLEYIICPSFSAQAGFSIVEPIPDDTIIDITMALIESTNNHISVLGCSQGSHTYEIKIQNMNGGIYGNIKALNGFVDKSLQVNTQYRFIARINAANYNVYGINIGYYRINDYKFKGRIYHAKIYNFVNVDVGDEENVLHEFIPAKRKADNKIGMYDCVNEIFYSSTTGTEFEAPTA